MRGGNILKYPDIKARIGKNILDPVYIFLGEEKYLKQEIIDSIKKIIITSSFSRDFNLHHFYSSDTNLNNVINTCNTLPVFSDKRIVIIEEIDKLKSLKILENYLASPSLSTVLILNSNERNLKNIKIKFGKTMTTVFYSLYDSALVDWIKDKCRKNNKNITNEAAGRLVNLCNNSLMEINNETEKLLIYSKDKEQITNEDINNLIGDTKEYSIYQLIDAILSSRFSLSLKIFKKLFQSGENIFYIFSSLNKNLHEIFLIKYLLEIKKMNSDEIIRNSGIHNYHYKSISVNIKKYNLNEITKIIKTLFEFDYKFKSYTAVNKPRLFEDLIYQLKLK